MLRLCLLTLFTGPLLAALAPDLPPGGANAPAELATPPAFVLGLTELPVGVGAVQVPTGSWQAPATGVEAYTLPGPLAAFRGADGVWRGHGYLETWSPPQSFTGTSATTADGWTASLDYVFAGDRHYRVALRCSGGRIGLEEDCQLGVRDVWVLDCAYGWQPTAALAFAVDGRHASRYLPCHYDRAEAVIAVRDLLDPTAADRAVAALTVVSPRASAGTMLTLAVREPATWRDGDRMGIELWQRRQLPGDPASRHFLGPETKSDGTPNSHTAARIGTSQYEGHVTIELRLGGGSRKLDWAFPAKPADLDAIPAAAQEALR